MKKYFKIGIFFLLTLVIIGGIAYSVKAAPSDGIQPVNISIGGDDSAKDYVSNIRLLILLTVLTILPSFLIMMTSFTRIIVTFSFLKSAIGAQQAIPNQVLIGVALFLTIFIMRPVYNDINTNALQPYM
jgi:flagellar biosynthetic protein FliP